MTFALLLACAITRRWRGAVLTALAVPLAIGVTDYVLKPTVGEAMGRPSPAGTPPAVSRWRPASPCCSPTRRSGCRPVRLLLVLLAVLMATAVAAAMVAIGAHTFSDAVGGAAVGVGVVLACALTLDALGSLLRPEPAAPPPPAARPATEPPAGSRSGHGRPRGRDLGIAPRARPRPVPWSATPRWSSPPPDRTAGRVPSPPAARPADQRPAGPPGGWLRSRRRPRRSRQHQVDERDPGSLPGQDRRGARGDGLVGGVPGGQAVLLAGFPGGVPGQAGLRHGGELARAGLGEQRAAVRGQGQRRPPADREQRGQPGPGGPGHEVGVLGQPVAGQVVAGDAVPGYPGAGRDRRPARPGPGRRGLVHRDLSQEAGLPERPDGRRAVRPQEVEPDPVHPHDQHVPG